MRRETRTKHVKTGTERYQVVSQDKEQAIYGEYATRAAANIVCEFLNLGVRKYTVVKKKEF